MSGYVAADLRDVEPLDSAAVRADFPIFERRIHGEPLVYLDTAATAQTPQTVLEAMHAYYTCFKANVHRGVYTLGQEATKEYEASRAAVASFLGLDDARQVVFTRGCTEAINLIAHAWLEPRLAAGDRILVGALEHHANLVPWQLVAERCDARMEPIAADARGDLDLEALERALAGGRVKLIAVAHVSNALGTVNDVARIVQLAHAAEVPVVVDGAQSAPHMPVDVGTLGADFFAASGHKMFGPTGIGFLAARPERLEEMRPWQGGGDMIREVSFAGTTFADPPQRFEAGTPPIAEAIGLGAAVRYLEGLGRRRVQRTEQILTERALQTLGGVAGMQILGDPRERAATISFVVEGTHALDIATLLDQDGIAVRAGHHCAQPALRHFGQNASVRVSFGPYNTSEEVDRLGESLAKVVRILRP